MDSSSPRRSVVSPQARRQFLVANLDSIPPRKPAPTGPLPQPPESNSSSPVQIRHRLSPEKQRPTTSERPKKTSLNKQGESEKASRGRDRSYSEPQARSRSVPASQDMKPSVYDPSTAPALPKVHIALPTSGLHNVGSLSPRTIMPPTPADDTPSLFSANRSSYLSNLSAKAAARRRSKSTGASIQIPVPSVSRDSLPSPPASPPATRVKFTDPEVISSHPPSMGQNSKSPTFETKIPFPRNSREVDFLAQATSPPPRKNSAPRLSNPTQSPTSEDENDPFGSQILASPTAFVDFHQTSQSRIPVSPKTSPRQMAGSSQLRLTTSIPPASQTTASLPKLPTPSTSPSTSRPSTRSVPLARISTTSRSLVNAPIASPSKISAPSESRLPTPRPPLLSQSKPRILSMATETTVTTTSTKSRAPTVSTAATSRSEAGTTPRSVAKVQVKRRPNPPTLFPPLPPATFAFQQSRLAQRSPGLSSGASAPPPPSGHQTKQRKQSGTWI